MVRNPQRAETFTRACCTVAGRQRHFSGAVVGSVFNFHSGQFLPSNPRCASRFLKAEGVAPRGTKSRRILSSTVGSDPFGKFSTLLDSSTAYKNADSHHYDPFCSVLNMELLQFYYSASRTGDLADRCSVTEWVTPSILNECNRLWLLKKSGWIGSGWGEYRP
jgi:hypothetical protein